MNIMLKDAEIKKLPSKVQSILRSSFNIYGYAQCVSELICNSLDAEATCIAVRVDISKNKIQVVDNGFGLTSHNFNVVGERYMTSKCKSLSDLKQNLNKFGYRGEALASIIAISEYVCIESRHKDSSTTRHKIFFKGSLNEDVKSPKDRPANGTTVTITNFMYNMRIRQKRIDPEIEMEEIRSAMERIALIHFYISFSLRNDCDKSLVLKTYKNKRIQDAFFFLMDDRVGDSLQLYEKDQNNYLLQLYIASGTHPNKTLQFVYINKNAVKNTEIQVALNNALLARSFYLREVNKKVIDKGIKNDQTEQNIFKKEKIQTKKYPVFIANLTCPYVSYDITILPDKSIVQFHDLNTIMTLIKKIVDDFVLKELGNDNLKDEIFNDLKPTKDDAMSPATNSLKDLVEVAIKKNAETFGASQLKNAVKGKPMRRHRKPVKNEQLLISKENSTTYKTQLLEQDTRSKSNIKRLQLKNNKTLISSSTRHSTTLQKDIHKHLDNNSKNRFLRETPFITSQMKITTSRIEHSVLKPIYNCKSAVKRFDKINLNTETLMNKVLKKQNYAEELLLNINCDSDIDKAKKSYVSTIYSDIKRCNERKIKTIAGNQHTDVMFSKAIKNSTANKKIRKSFKRIKISDNDCYGVIHKKSIEEYTLTLPSQHSLKYSKCFFNNNKQAANFISTYDLVNTRIDRKMISKSKYPAKQGNSTKELCFNRENNFISALETHNLRQQDCYVQTDIALKDFERLYKYYFDNIKYERNINTIINSKEIHDQSKIKNYLETKDSINKNEMRFHTYNPFLSQNNISYSKDNHLRNDLTFTLDTVQLNNIDNGLSCNKNQAERIKNVASFDFEDSIDKRYGLNIRSSTLNSIDNSHLRIEAKYRNIGDLSTPKKKKYNTRYEDLARIEIDNRHIYNIGNSDKFVLSFEDKNCSTSTSNKICVDVIQKPQDREKSFNKDIFANDLNVITSLSTCNNIFGETYTIKGCDNDVSALSDEFQFDKSLRDCIKSEFNSEFVNKNNDHFSDECDMFKTITDSEFKQNLNSVDNDKSALSDGRVKSDEYKSKVESVVNSSCKFEDLNMSSTSGVENPIFIENDVKCSKNLEQKHTDKTSATPEKHEQEWLFKIDSNGKVFYLNKRTGMTLYENPSNYESSMTYKAYRRPSFVPKGISPILKLPEGKHLKEKNDNQIVSDLSTNKSNRRTDALIKYKWSEPYHEEHMYDVFASELIKHTDAMGFKIADEMGSLKNSFVRSRSILKSLVFEKTMLNNAEIINQVDAKFIAVIFRDRKIKSTGHIVLFDQHAVDERIRLERFLKEYQDNERWQSCRPEKSLKMVLGQSDLTSIMKYKDNFSNLGLTFNKSKINESEIEITSLPSCFMNRNGTQQEDLLNLVEQLISEEIQVMLSTKGNASSIPGTIMRVISSEACHGAIKFGMKLTIEKCKDMMNSLSKCDFPFQCAHGRPVMAALLDLSELKYNKSTKINFQNLKKKFTNDKHIKITNN